jgi:ADP-ribose pyrophosphatase YjhB (NUDIX family)
MPGDGPFVWIRDQSSPRGFWHAPEGGMCVNAFLFVRKGPDILLGKYADHPAWDELAGLDSGRRQRFGTGWTVPGSHLKFGEDPRTAARRIGEEILQVQDMGYSEPRVETDTYPAAFAGGKTHYDIWFFFDATPPPRWTAKAPPWYTELAWHDPRTLPASAYARSHEDVVARWLQNRTGP